MTLNELETRAQDWMSNGRALWVLVPVVIIEVCAYILMSL